ncbi:MAG: serine/threonine-protein kinase [Leptolyngbya sp.]|nr:serine/threonine-protein kinase [Leptolyngbya sp.]
MICCLNPSCPQPNHATLTRTCPSCGSPLIAKLRGRYRPLKFIGQGGFGRTYFALDADRLNHRCVIKQFAPQRQGTKSFLKAVQLFEQEAIRLNDLGEHPQIPNLLAYFEQDKYLYLVQQMISGRTLFQEVIAQGPYDEDAVRHLLEDVLPVLDFIHGRGVIHRDITPSNIIRRKADGVAILIDFGVAKQFSEAVLCEPGTRIGTEGYAPMEQLRSGQAYPSSDLYSLGVTCLHCLTGCRPEDLYQPMEGRWGWQDRLQQMGRTISPGLADILTTLTRDLVSDRYPSAQDVIRDVQRLSKRSGTVPGWHKAAGPDSLFAGLSQIPISGPGDGAGLSSPKAVPPSPPPSSPPPSSPPPPPPPRTPPPAAPPTSAQPSLTTPGWNEVEPLIGHQSWVVAVAFNPKQPMLVSGSLDDTVRIWNWELGQLLHTLPAHDRGVNGIALGNGGQVLASCGDDATVKVWNLSDRTLLHVLKGHLRDVTTVAIGARGFLLASGSEDGTIRLWTLDRGNLVKTLVGSAGIIKSVAWAKDDSLLISGGLDNTVRLWNPQTEVNSHILTGHTNTVNQVAVSPDGQWVASASKDRSVRLWHLPNGDKGPVLQGHTQEVNAVAFFPEGRRLVSGSSDGTLRIWHIDGSLQHTIQAHSSPIHSVAVHRQGKSIASASADKTIKLWQWVS